MEVKKVSMSLKNKEVRKLVPISVEIHSKAKTVAAQSKIYLGELAEIALSDLLRNKARLKELQAQSSSH